MKYGIWETGWKETVYEHVNESGYSDVTAFASSMPGVPYRQLAQQLDEGVAPVQLQKLMHEEALATGRLDFFARDSLSRYLRQNLPDGWAFGSESEFKTAHAFASWSAALSVKPAEKIDILTRNVWDKLHQIARRGWKVRGPDDPVLLTAFESVNFDTSTDL